MTHDELERRLQQALALLPPPAGIPPASNNPGLQQRAQELMIRLMEIIQALVIVGPPSPVVPTPPPPSQTP
jgi:hypothetical protein